MRGRAAAAAVAGMLLAGACASGGRRPPPHDPDLRIWSPGLVHWGPDQERAMRFAIENGTNRTLSVPEPDASGARVEIFGEGEAPLCSVSPGERASVGRAAGEPLELAPGEQAIVRVDLAEACAGLAAGEYRYEIGYRLPPSEGQGAVQLPTRYGTLVVQGNPRASARTGPPVPRRPPPR